MRRALAPLGPVLSLDQVAERFLAATLEQDPESAGDVTDSAQSVIDAWPEPAGARYVLSRRAEPHTNTVPARRTWLRRSPKVSGR